ncbi:MAG: hypothetical protein IMY77_04295 [Chloroflexi bacterium]|nr:hypothetical protein [Chloroflexota bacterium]
MSEKPAKETREMKNIGPVEAYDILMQRTIDENRLLTERTTIFLAASSILFLAFVMLNQSSTTLSLILAKPLSIILSSLGIFLTLVFYSLARGSIERLEFLWHSQENMERESPEFTYMKDKKFAPYTDRTDFLAKDRKWKQNDKNIWTYESTASGRWGMLSRSLAEHASKKCIPAIFGTLWLASLIIALINLFNS